MQTIWQGYIIKDNGEVLKNVVYSHLPEFQPEEVKKEIIKETQKKLWETQEAILYWEAFIEKLPELHSGQVMLELAQSIRARCRKILEDLGVDMS